MKRTAYFHRCLLTSFLLLLPTSAFSFPLLGGIIEPVTDTIDDLVGDLIIPPEARKNYVIRPNPDAPLGLDLGQIVTLLLAIGDPPRVEIDGAGLDPKVTAVSSYLTLTQVLSLISNPLLVVTEEIPLTSNGVNNDPDTALATIGEAFSSPGTYTYLDTAKPVRLYLIDTAVANPNNWIGANEKLNFEKTILIRGSADPTESSSFKHGTQLLSLIGGMETGAAPGVPLNVINYDIYPQGDTTTSTLLAKAVVEAVRDFKNTSDPMPSAICIATSSAAPSTSYTLRSAIELAIAEGIPVIISAGNLGKDASSYIPSAYGSIDGVICTGSLARTELPLASSNFGPSVDLFAPGQDLRTFAPDSGSTFVTMTGTSPASALVAAIALTEISANEPRTPAQIENSIKASAKTISTNRLLRATVAPTVITVDPESSGQPASSPKFAEAPDGSLTEPSEPVSLGQTPTEPQAPTPGAQPDRDQDGVPDTLEIFHGTDPDSTDTVPAEPHIAISGGEMQFSFPIAPMMLDPENPFTLRNGYTWRIECSDTMATWNVPVGGITKTTDANGRIWITANIPVTTPSCFTRLVVVAQ